MKSGTKKDFLSNIPANSFAELNFIKQNPSVFGRNAADEIRKIVFLDHLPEMKGKSMNIAAYKSRNITACLAKDRKTLYIGADGGINASDCCRHMFRGLEYIEEIVFEYDSFHSDSAKSFSGMFENCRNLKSLSLGGIRTPESKSFSDMFRGCESLTSLNVSGFETSSCTDFSRMFAGCKSLQSIDLTGFAIHKGTRYAKLFDERCNAYWFRAAPKIREMFKDCESLKTLDLRSFSTASVDDFTGMFENCRDLQTLKLGSSFVISRTAYTDRMFDGCDKLDKKHLPANRDIPDKDKKLPEDYNYSRRLPL